MALNFSYLDAGDPEALPVLFLHAFPYHAGMWGAQRDALSNRYRCLAFDVRGLGSRSSETGAYMLEHTVDDLFALLDALSLAPCVLCGVSMGGYAALRAIARAPERFAGLVLANTQAAADSDAAKLARAEGLRLLRREGVRAFAELQVGRQLSPRSRAERPALAASLVDMAVSASAEGIAASLVAIATRTDQTPALAEIRVPSLVLAGGDDAVTPPILAEQLASAIPGARLRVFPGVGHLSNLEAETAFTAELGEFLAGLS